MKSLLVLLSLLNPPAEAGRLAGGGGALIRKGVQRLAADLSNRTLYDELLLPNGKTRTISLTLGDREGGGVFGSVYYLAGISLPSLTGLEPGLSGVIKFAQSFAALPMLGPPSMTRNGIYREDEATAIVLQNLEAIEANRWFPKNPAWQRGFLPAMPIKGKAVLKRFGPVLFKPYIAKTDGIWAEQLRKADLTQPMIDDLKDIYDAVQAIGETTGIWIDIAGVNFIWAKSKRLQRIAHLQRASWVLPELDQVQGNYSQYSSAHGYSFEDFLWEFKRYLAK